MNINIDDLTAALSQRIAAMALEHAHLFALNSALGRENEALRAENAKLKAPAEPVVKAAA